MCQRDYYNTYAYTPLKSLPRTITGPDLKCPTIIWGRYMQKVIERTFFQFKQVTPENYWKKCKKLYIYNHNSEE